MEFNSGFKGLNGSLKTVGVRWVSMNGLIYSHYI